jgi:hypothetical protein
MTDNNPALTAFIERTTQRPLPKAPAARARTLAKELAEGTLEQLWWADFVVAPWDAIDPEKESVVLIPRNEQMQAYLLSRWGSYRDVPNWHILHSLGYLTTTESNRFTATYLMAKAAFDLVEETESSDVFISYRRKDSSAFALLVLARLKAAGINGFLDMTIQPGDNWQDHLKAQIQKRDYFVILLGPESLQSPEVIREMEWALEANVQIIPIWHGGFIYASGKTAVPDRIDHLLRATHTIRVLEESALGYNNAIVELLNRFGVTPN